jgi:hypothetical protein
MFFNPDPGINAKYPDPPNWLLCTAGLFCQDVYSILEFT